MVSKSISEFKNTFDETFDYVLNFDEPVILTTGKGNAVIISEAVFESLKESLFIGPTKELIKRIKEGEKEKISSMKSYEPNEKW